MNLFRLQELMNYFQLNNSLNKIVMVEVELSQKAQADSKNSFYMKKSIINFELYKITVFHDFLYDLITIYQS